MIHQLNLKGKFDFQSDPLKDKDVSLSQRLRELRIDLLESIDNLSSKNREQLLLLHYFHGFSLKEIARKMNN
jgi:DNA-directed RNA polymerase specialized sigma24 family protein